MPNEFMAELTAITENILHTFGRRIVDALKEDIKTKSVTKFGPVNASGALYNSIRYEVTDGKLKVFGNNYIWYLVFGRKPGKFPPREAIKEWIRVKGILSNPSASELNSLAFLIQRKIARQGTTIWQQGGSDLVSGIINPDLINDLRNELFINYQTEIINSFQSDFLPVAA